MRIPAALFAMVFLMPPPPVAAADTVYSGPQPGEKTTPFRVLEMTGANAGRARDPVAENAGAPTAWVFIQGLERSMVPLLRVVDEYGAMRRETLKTEMVFLWADRLQGEQRVKAASGSLRLQSRVGLSLDGAEGPGNYGLNRDCLMTILTVKDNVVVTNFALVQPGIADAPRVLKALAQVCGDTNPPPVEQFTERMMARRGTSRPEGMMRRGESPEAAPEGRRAGTSPNGERFPGAVPTDLRLQGMLRQLIRPTTDEASVDAALKEMKAYVGDHADLRQQAIDGWTRVLHFGDRYGTEYSRKAGRKYLEELQNRAP